MNERISCGSVRSATCCPLSWRALAAVAASDPASAVKLAPASPVNAAPAQPTSAATATVPSSTASTTTLMRPRFSVTFVRVNAPTIATNTSGITSIFRSAM